MRNNMVLNKWVKQTSTYQLFALLFLLAPLNLLYAQNVVKTSSELGSLLSEDKEQGTILLDGDLFMIAGTEAKAGGIVKPYPGRMPVIIGFHQKVVRGKRSLGDDGYWTIPIKSYNSDQIVFLDESLAAIPYACHINGEDGFTVIKEQIQICDKEKRQVKIPIPQGFDYLKKRERKFFKNASIKMGYWFVGIQLRGLHSDDEFLFGTVDNEYNFNLLSVRPYANVRIEFFNLPIVGDGIYFDGNDVLHVPARYKVVYVCTTPPIMKLTGDRDLTFEGITFTGANNNAIEVGGSNKHFMNCTVRNCGKGIVGIEGVRRNCSVVNCLFENLYNNIAISLGGVDDVAIESNILRHTGSLYKGGSVITVGGLNVNVKNNNISDFSYNAISVGISRIYKPHTLTGVVSSNVVDNLANYGNPNNQLDDGGGIYVLAHTDGVEISDNIVRNIGYDKGWIHGIYLDDGAYNVSVKRNLVYNINPSGKAVYSRFVKECERSNMNNVFVENILVGNSVMAGNQNGYGEKTLVSGNFVTGVIDFKGESFVSSENNKEIKVEVNDKGVLKVKRRSGLKKGKYSKEIRKLIKF